MGNGIMLGVLAELRAASLNVNLGGGDHASGYFVERQVIDWLKEIMGFSTTASGLLTTGGWGANLVAAQSLELFTLADAMAAPAAIERPCGANTYEERVSGRRPRGRSARLAGGWMPDGGRAPGRTP